MQKFCLEPLGLSRGDRSGSIRTADMNNLIADGPAIGRCEGVPSDFAQRADYRVERFELIS